MRTLPILTVIIPTHKRATILRECLRHLERQTVRDFIEVIVVSDGHDPQTVALFARTSDQSSPRLRPAGRGLRTEDDWNIFIKFFEVEKSQQGAARNRGVQEAKGEYVLFIGDDIFLAADACEKHMLAHAYAGAHTAVLGHITWDPQVGITPVMWWLERTGWQFGYQMLAPYAHGFVPADIQHRFTYTSNLSLPMNLARTIPFLRTDLYGWEDIEWGRRLADAGVHLFYEPDAKAWHHHHIALEESLRRMETLGQSAARMAERDPHFDRVPRGWKRAACHALSLLPTMRGRHAKAFLKGMSHETRDTSFECKGTSSGS